MFGHLDNDGDRKLSLSELYGLEHDQNEPCLKPFLDACDADGSVDFNKNKKINDHFSLNTFHFKC